MTHTHIHIPVSALISRALIVSRPTRNNAPTTTVVVATVRVCRHVARARLWITRSRINLGGKTCIDRKFNYFLSSRFFFFREVYSFSPPFHPLFPRSFPRNVVPHRLDYYYYCVVTCVMHARLLLLRILFCFSVFFLSADNETKTSTSFITIVVRI